VKSLFLAYRVLATVVGLSIITLVVVGVPLEHLHQAFPDFWTGFLQSGEPGQKLGDAIDSNLGVAHGFIYMVFVLVALMLALRMRWPMVFTLVTLVCGTIPFLSFWAEARAIRRVRAAHPEL
jgi:integral membrane protein